MTALLDTNILIKMLDPADADHAWCVTTVEEHKALGPAVISDIIFCEFAAGMASLDAVHEAIGQLGLERIPVNDNVLFRAGMAFKTYKERGGPRTNVLPDFLIGAAAEVLNLPLITTNQKDYIGYFPRVAVVCPKAA